MEISQRPLNDDERRGIENVIASSKGMTFRGGCSLVIAFAGILAIAAVLEWLHASDYVAWPILLGSVVLGLSAVTLVELQAQKPAVAKRKLLRQDLVSGIVVTHRLIATRVAEIEEWEDLGVGFLFEIADHQLIFLRQQDFADYSGVSVPHAIDLAFTEKAKFDLGARLSGEPLVPVAKLPAKCLDYSLHLPFAEPFSGSFDAHVESMQKMASEPTKTD